MATTENNNSGAPHKSAPTNADKLSNKEVYENTLSGTQDQRHIPLLRSDTHNYQKLAHSLSEFKALEGAQREERLKEVWKRLPMFDGGKEKGASGSGSGSGSIVAIKSGGDSLLTKEKADELKEMYENELVGRCRPGSDASAHSGPSGSAPHISWKDFYRYAEAKEVGAQFSLL